MKKVLSLRSALALAICLGLLLPAVFNGWRTLQQQKVSLTERLKGDEQRLSSILAHALAHSLWSLDFDTIGSLINAAGEDERVVDIKITADKSIVSTEQELVALPKFSHPERRRGHLLLLTQKISRSGQEFGRLELAMDTGQIDDLFAQEFRRFLLTSTAQLILSLGMILIILEFRFVQPVKKLLIDSGKLAKRELESAFHWSRSDELGALGKSLEETRLSLHRAFSELQESEVRYRSLTTMSSDWYWERDKEGRLTLISDGFEDISGIPAAQMLGRSRGELGNFEYDPEQWANYRHCVEKHLPFEILVWKVIRLDGEVRYGMTRGEPIFDKKGEFCGYRGTGKDITNEKLIEEAQKSTARLRQLVEHLPAGAFYIEDGKTFLNQAAEKLTGFTRVEIPNVDACFSHIFSRDCEYIRRQYEADKEQGFPLPREIELQRKDGSRRLIEFSAFVDEYSEVWLMHDVTQRKQFEVSLKQTLQEQDAIFNNTVAGIEYVKDRIILRCNKGFEEMLGYGPGELVGKSTKIYYANERDWIEHGKFAYADLKGEVLKSEWQYRKKDGSMIFCSINGKMIDSQKGLNEGVIFVTLDITAQKHAEAAFHQAYAEQQIIFENASAGIILIKSEKIQRCNRTLEKILGYQPGELIGQAASIMFPSAQSYSRFVEASNAVIGAGKPWTGEWEVMRKDASCFWFGLQGRLIDYKNQEIGAIWVVNDHSERKKTEAVLLETKKRLEHTLTEIEKTNTEVMLLSELSSYLQACSSTEEAYAGLAEFGPRLFPDSAGAIFLMEEEFLSARASWGDADLYEQTFLSNDCWALRRGQVYRMDVPVKALCCSHLHSGHRELHPYVCLPLVAQGETFGLLVIEHRHSIAEDRIEIRQRLCVAFAEQSGLALANLRLRGTLQQQSMRDPLTGLFNRRQMNISLRRELSQAQRNATSMAVAIVDVDYFKQFNDTYGHDAGDQVLQAVAKALTDQAHTNDVICRFGGEEFVLILPVIRPLQALERAEVFLQAIRALELTHGNRPLRKITASLGIAFYPHDGETADRLLDVADAALYAAKEKGRNRAVHLNAQPDEESEHS